MYLGRTFFAFVLLFDFSQLLESVGLSFANEPPTRHQQASERVQWGARASIICLGVVHPAPAELWRPGYLTSTLTQAGTRPSSPLGCSGGG